MENPILIWLIPSVLLPIFFGMGWIAARIDLKTVIKQAKVIPIRIYKSLDALIDNNSNVAASTLAEIIEDEDQSGQTIESYELALTLGKLFRKRGENDKAISLHQQLLNINDLPEEKLPQIHFELGKDYQSAGLVDRAETELESLLKTPYKEEVSRHLLLIYQQDRAWEKAIELASSLPSSDFTQQFDIAQFYCELAQKALIESQLTESAEYVHKALEVNRKCTRANIILGNIEQKRQNYQAAINAYTAIEKQNFNYLTMVGEQLFDAYDALAKPEEGLNLLIGYMQTFPQLNLTNIIYEKALTLWDKKKADEVTANLIRINPNLEKIYLLSSIIMNDNDRYLKTDTDIINKILATQITKSFMYQCKHCHFKSQVFFWRCPACGKWEVFTPNRIEV